MYVVVIPSYQRAELLKEQTLATLQKGDVSAKLIYIFVASKEEEKLYNDTIPKNMYNKIVIGVKGINEQRKYIMKYFPEKQQIVSLDDDIKSVVTVNGSTVTNLHDFFLEAFKEIKKNKLFMWGVYPCDNAFYMKGQKPTTTCLRFIIAALYGFVNRHDMILDSKIQEKEDVENSIKYYLRDGGVLRFNHIGIKTKFKNTKGGLGGIENRFKANKEAAEYLHAKYPEITRIKIRKNGMYEIVLKTPRKC